MRFFSAPSHLLIILVLGCSSDPAGGTTVRGGDAQMDAPITRQDGSTTPDSTVGSDAHVGTDGALGPDANIEPDAGEIVCANSGACPQTHFCDLGNDCAAPGICKLIPDCGDTGTAVCGCDEQTYESACIANEARITVASSGSCKDEVTCEPMDATGSGANDCPWGFKWTGSDCVQVRGCNGCSGADCDKLFTFQQCEAHKVMCAS